MPKAKKKPDRCHETTASDLQNTTFHEVLSQSKCRVYSSHVNLHTTKAPATAVYPPVDHSMHIPDDEMVDSGMGLNDITMEMLDEQGEAQPVSEPGNLKVNLKTREKAKRYPDSDVLLVTWQESH
ncbi:hypothetical protein PM082_022127 [Marasmius tenuissimus]|nr:hypothetical protein PM082_022127 [Marasmius tenuissimus]